MRQQESVHYLINKHASSQGVPELDERTLGLKDSSSASLLFPGLLFTDLKG